MGKIWMMTGGRALQMHHDPQEARLWRARDKGALDRTGEPAGPRGGVFLVASGAAGILTPAAGRGLRKGGAKPSALARLVCRCA